MASHNVNAIYAMEWERQTTVFAEPRAVLVELMKALTFFAGVWYGSRVAFYAIEVDAIFDESGLPASRDGGSPACDCVF
jgi:hypothetical protein